MKDSRYKVVSHKINISDIKCPLMFSIPIQQFMCKAKAHELIIGIPTKWFCPSEIIASTDT